ncbi:MAG: alpha/beta fold hydrolase, partial [Spirochaetota bacterium]
MKRSQLVCAKLAGVLLATLFVLSCATAPTVVTDGALPAELPRELLYFAEKGNTPFGTIEGIVESETGCEVSYTHFFPGNQATPDDPLLVLAHGFLRTKENMRGWAELFASHGVRTVAVTFCNSTLFSGNHEQNARDLRLVADELAGTTTPVLYAGYSAGGLSALLAAAADERTFGYLGIDPVDSGGQMEAVTELPSTALYLLAEPSSCNRNGATRPLLPQATPAWFVEIPYATHCTFEDPTDRTCIRVCGTVEPEDANDTLRSIIQGVGTLFVVAQFGTDPLAVQTL